jgi:hypothetical protein
MLQIYFRLFNTLECCCPRRIWLLREEILIRLTILLSRARRNWKSSSPMKTLKNAAEHSGFMDFMINIVGSSAGTVAIVVGSFAVWFGLKIRYGEMGHVEN